MSSPFPRTSTWKPGDHVSASSAVMWGDRCSAAWWFDRVLRIPAFDRAFFLIGGEMHKVAEIQLTAKRDKQPILSMTQIAELITADLGLRFSVPGVKCATGETPAMCIEDTICMAEKYMAEIFPRIEPLAIEMPVGPDQGLRLPGTGTPVKAVLDCIDQYAGIRDLKTAKAKWPDGSAERKLQSQVYFWCYRVLYQAEAPYLIYDLLVRKRRGKKQLTAECEYHEIKVTPDPVLQFGAMRRLEAIVDQMKKGQYFPNHSHECNDCSFLEFCNQHFAEQPFAPWAEREAAAQVMEGPKLIRVGGRNGNGGNGTGASVDRAQTVAVQATGDRPDGNGDGNDGGDADA